MELDQIKINLIHILEDVPMTKDDKDSISQFIKVYKGEPIVFRKAMEVFFQILIDQEIKDIKCQAFDSIVENTKNNRDELNELEIISSDVNLGSKFPAVGVF